MAPLEVCGFEKMGFCLGFCLLTYLPTAFDVLYKLQTAKITYRLPRPIPMARLRAQRA